jgi:release factor glutamine methyltransferase
VASAADPGLARLIAAGIDNAGNEWRWLREHNADPAWLEIAVTRRCGGEPFAYIVGNQEFYGVTIEVTPAVLIPRPETEGIIDAVRALHTAAPLQRLADIGTGSGAIPIAAALQCDIADLFACDLSSDALAVARRNVERAGLAHRITLGQGHLAQPLIDAGWGGTIDCLTANLPYVADGERDTLQREVREEPALALFAGADGLDLIRELAQQLPDLLAPSGTALFEIGIGQEAAVEQLLCDRGCVDVHTTNDLAGIPRIVHARRAAST